jgi:membrane-associated protease RseP (regulator of RpoE activity)
MNILLAIFLLTWHLHGALRIPGFIDKPAVIAWSQRQDSAAAKAGVQPGDRIVKIDGIENPTWEQVQPRVMLSPNQPLDITIQRGRPDLPENHRPKPVTTSEVGSAGWYPAEPGDRGGRPRRRHAGRQSGHQAKTTRSSPWTVKPLGSIDAMIEQLQQTKDKPVDLDRASAARNFDFHLQPVLADETEDPKSSAIAWDSRTRR